MPEGAEVVRGVLERITFANEQNGWVVYKLTVKGASDLVTAVGSTTPHMPGEELELTGEWTRHPRFGRQFKFTACRSLMPSTVEGIKRYLGSGLVKGVGPKTAERIVEEFGEETFDVLDERPADLLRVRGISDKLLDSIKQSWEAQKEVRAVMFFLQSNGVSPNFAAKIFAEYGTDTIQVVKEDPYRLANDIFGIGFLTADRVAANMGVPQDSPQRAKAGVRYVMGELTNEGHVYAPREVLAKRSAELLGFEQEDADRAIIAAASDGELKLERIVSPEGELDAVYLPAYYTAETKGAQMLSELSKTTAFSGAEVEFSVLDRAAAAQWVSDVMHIDLAPRQLDAIDLASRSKTMIITGGPGTGKTTIIRAVIGIWGERGLRIQLAAPTGRAAKRLSEATGLEAKTIHRMLEFSGDGSGFARGRDNPLECDLLVVDEASMIDTILFYHMMRAIPRDCRLILVGDVDQLPSVGPGNVLADLIASGAIPTAELNEIFRQAESSSIIVNAHRVNAGSMPVEPQREGLKDLYIIEQEDPDRCVELIRKLLARMKAAYGFDPLDDVQVLTPMHRGTLGSSNLNSVLQAELNGDPGARVERGDKAFRVGDKVMQIKNDYEREVFNGDIGRVVAADPAVGVITVDMDGREIAYEREDFDELMHAYAVSIHKSQGSEYPAVIIPIHTQHYMMLKRNLLYTAITRGRELVVIVGTKKALAIAVRTDDTKHRWTHLAQRLRDLA